MMQVRQIYTHTHTHTHTTHTYIYIIVSFEIDGKFFACIFFYLLDYLHMFLPRDHPVTSLFKNVP